LGYISGPLPNWNTKEIRGTKVGAIFESEERLDDVVIIAACTEGGDHFMNKCLDTVLGFDLDEGIIDEGTESWGTAIAQQINPHPHPTSWR
jgi:hypothetical protein